MAEAAEQLDGQFGHVVRGPCVTITALAGDWQVGSTGVGSARIRRPLLSTRIRGKIVRAKRRTLGKLHSEEVVFLVIGTTVQFDFRHFRHSTPFLVPVPFFFHQFLSQNYFIDILPRYVGNDFGSPYTYIRSSFRCCFSQICIIRGRQFRFSFFFFFCSTIVACFLHLIQ